MVRVGIVWGLGGGVSGGVGWGGSGGGVVGVGLGWDFLGVWGRWWEVVLFLRVLQRRGRDRKGVGVGSGLFGGRGVGGSGTGAPEGLFSFDGEAEAARFAVTTVAPGAAGGLTTVRSVAKRQTDAEGRPRTVRVPKVRGGTLARRRPGRWVRVGGGGEGERERAEEEAKEDVARGGMGDRVGVEAGGAGKRVVLGGIVRPYKPPRGPPRQLGPSEEEVASLAAAARAVGAGTGSERDALGEMLHAYARLRSAEDVVAFFARFGASCPAKFVYLNRAPSQREFRPYDLEVVPEACVAEEHFAMSAKGIVHVCPGQPSESLTLGEWTRQSSAFNVVRQLRFFREFVPRKSMDLWLGFARFSKFRKRRAQVEQQLFLTMPAFGPKLKEIRALVDELRLARLVSTKDCVRMAASAFMEAQAQRRHEAQRRIDRVLVAVVRLLKAVCKDVTERASAKLDEEEDDELGGAGAGAAGASARSKSIREAKEERSRKRSARRQAAREEARLGPLIRLVDYMVVEALSDRVVADFAELYHRMESPDAALSKSGLFVTALRFDDSGGTRFEPSEEDFCTLVDQLVGATVETVTREPRILSVRAFERFLAELPPSDPAYAGGYALHGWRDAAEDPQGDAEVSRRAAVVAADAERGRHLGLGAPSVSEVLHSWSPFRRAIGGIKRTLARDFADAHAFANMDTFHEVRPVYDFMRSAEASSYADRTLTVTAMRREMNNIHQWDQAVRAIVPSSVRGCLSVEAKELRTALEPVTADALERIKTALLHQAATTCAQCHEKFRERAAIFEIRPTFLAEYAAHKERLDRLNEQQEALLAAAQTVDDMYKLVRANGTAPSMEEEYQQEEMKKEQANYEEARLHGLAYMERELEDKKQDLDRQIIALGKELAEVEGSLSKGVFVDADRDPADVLAEIERVEGRLRRAAEQESTYRHWQKLFEQAPHEIKALASAKAALEQTKQLWSQLHEFETKHRHWTRDPLITIDIPILIKDSQTLFKSSFVADRKIGNAVSALFKRRTNDWRKHLPVIEELGNEFIRERHWRRLYEELGRTYAPRQSESHTIHDLEEMGALDAKDLVSDVSGTASGEHQLEESLEKVRKGWEDAQFALREHRGIHGLWVLGGLEDIFVLVEDNQVTLQTMLGSRFIAGVRSEVETWDHKLSLLSDTLDEWALAQRQWMYLENIFGAEDIQRQLPAEAAKFATVDKRWKEVMARTHANPAVLAAVETGDELLRTFQQCNSLLEEIQRSLDEYLETKRAAFPRFYFLSDDDLLAILSQTRDPQAVQPHLQGCFDAIKSLRFGSEDDGTQHEMFAMCSPESEEVPFSAAVVAAGNVENWLGDVEKMMRTTLYNDTRRALQAYPPTLEAAVDRRDWFFVSSAQGTLCIDQIIWTRGVEDALRQMQDGSDPEAMVKFRDFSLRQIDAMVDLVRTDLSKLQRMLMGTLMIVDVHARDVVRSMVANGVDSLDAYEWTRQLRYYWDEDLDNVVVRQTNARFLYGFEYLGNSPRLVITPLTDQCYMTLTGALHLKFGGAPAGPAGTGKTETTKDLAKALAVQCVVFNCSDGLDYKMMGRFFAGLAQAGAWACFDEFNRIDIEVLSVIAQQILTIQQGLIAGEAHIEFEGREISLSSGFGVFITMNPGYAGRTELPDNLKALFRPVAMMVPDYRLIAEIILFSQGFSEALELSNKMVQLYKLSSEQLSKQDHYDFGMRAVKSVLVAAGQLKRKEPDVDENIILIRAMRDSNVPKFLEHDLPLFRGILRDLFPGVDVPFVDYGQLQLAIENQLRLRGLQVVPSLVTKVIQVHETQLVRHGMMVVGVAGCGKTTNIKVLASALSQLYSDGVKDKDGFFKTVHVDTLNPKSVTMGELYGEINKTSGEWTDGIVAALVRRACDDTSGDRRWIVFDGPVDALWIENMNTVLDDNKTLCLANGQRIKLPSTLHMMFEVQDLAVASPATVSRCGMVYQEFVHVGVEAILDTWLRGKIADLLPEDVDRLRDRIMEHVPKTLQFLRRNCREVVESVDINLAESFLAMLSTLLSPANHVRGTGWRKHPRTAAEKAQEEAEAAKRAKEAVNEIDGADLVAPPTPTSPTTAAAEAEAEGLMAEDVAAAAAAKGDGEAGGGDGDVGVDDVIVDDDDDGITARPAGSIPYEPLKGMVDALYAFAFVWSFGANLHDESRRQFNQFAKALLGHSLPPLLQGSDGDLYDFFVDTSPAGDRAAVAGGGALWKVRPWTDQVKEFEFNTKTPFFNLLVPTMDTTRYAYLLRTLAKQNRNVLFTGMTGVGKSVIIADTLGDLCGGDEAEFVSTTINLSAQTASRNIVDALEAALDKKRKTLLGPPAGKTMLVFVDDLNMPALEEYGAQPPIELLRQTIDIGGFYDTAKLFFKRVADSLFISACAPPGGGRNPVTPRLLRHFHMVWLEALGKSSMCRIFDAILGGFLLEAAPELQPNTGALVEAAVNVYLRVEKELLPTPTKSHYTFNLRDLSKVFQGILMVDPTVLQRDGTKTLLRLWLHEEQRVFRDRLIDNDDRSWFNNVLRNMLVEGPLKEIAEPVAPTPGEDVGGGEDGEDGEGGLWPVSSFEDVLFGDFVNRDDKKYVEVEDVHGLDKVFGEVLEEYNVTFPTPMHLVFFKDAIAHVSRISRILRQPRGNALLVGVGGSGRSSMTRVAAFMAEYDLRSIEITRTYGVDAWREDLKQVLMSAGIHQKHTVFLFSDVQVKEESFLEDINNILNSGDVPNLYAPDEVEQILNGVRGPAKAAGVTETRDALMNYYVYQVREHLHMVLCFSPIGDSFRARCRMFPALINTATCDWFDPWPEDALYSVAMSVLTIAAAGGRAAMMDHDGTPEEDLPDPLGIRKFIDPLCQMCVRIHRGVEVMSRRFLLETRRHNYTTPTSYLELLRLYETMLGEHRDRVQNAIERYEGGLLKLGQTEKMVSELQEKLTALRPTLERAKEETEALLEKLAVDQKEADEAAAQAEKDAAETARQARHVKEIKEDCQRDLDEAMPAYYSALRALESLNKKQIQEVKSFAKPPELVQTVMEAVCILMGAEPNWVEAKRLLSDMRFIDRLKEYDKDNIEPKIIKKVMRYYNRPDFDPEKVKSVSMAATSLCMWVRAMVKYDEVAKTIEPKRNALKEAEDELAGAQSALAEKQAALKTIQDRVAALQKQYEESVAKKEMLEEQQKATELRLERAHKLIDGLGNEAGRWKAAAAQLAKDRVNLVGNIMLAAGSVAYIGPFTADFRTKLSNSWARECTNLGIPVDPAFDLVRILADPVVVREWNIQGLPADAFSTENGLFATLGRRWPLMIDPQGQANRWIKKMQKDASLQVIKLSESDFLRTLENGIRFGQPVLLENVEEELDPAIEPVLLKQVFKKQGLAMLRLGDTDVPYSEDFKFYITTKLANPHYLPEVCVKVTVINFTVTRKGLEDQLLVDVVAHERPDLEERKDQLIVSIASDKRQLKEIEDRILRMLAEATGDILDDEELIESLAASKETSAAINERMQEAERTTKEINEAREGYRPVATRASILYFVIADLAGVDPMYQYSLQAFTRLYNMRIERSESREDVDERVELLVKDLTVSFYDNVCRGLFETHKLLYSFTIAVNVDRHRGAISEDEWAAFLVGSAGTDDAAEGGIAPPPDSDDWLPGKTWASVIRLTALPPLEKLAEDIAGNPAAWRVFAKSKEPHVEPLPGRFGAEGAVTPFQRLLILRALREEKTLFGVRELVRHALGDHFGEAPPFDLKGAFGDSTSSTPLIFVLSPGADPIDYLIKLANEQGKGPPGLRIISLGQGQGPVAERAMEEARRTGEWVCLQNCHLSISWLPKLEANLEQVGEGSGADVHPDFRLWLTSMPSPKFPVPILQNGIKITQEPPRGLRANLRRTFADMTEEDYEGCTKKREFKKLLFGLAFFHALILERRKFGAIGWNIPYEWMGSDIKTGIMQLRGYLEEQDSVPYETLNSIVGTITYGGRATDAKDKRTLLSILGVFFVPEIMDDSYRFSDSGIYYAPPASSLEDVRAYIESLPLDDPPEIFGLHDNAAITLQNKESDEMMATLVNMQPRSAGSGGGGKSSEETVLDLADGILSKLPKPFDKEAAHEDTFKTTPDGSVNSMGVFCEQEMVRFNALIKVLRESLVELKKALQGLVVMSEGLETMFRCLLFQRVPPAWEDAAYPSLKPLGSWVEDLLQRLDMMRRWIEEGPPPVYWISGFYFPQGFMTAVLQTYARATHIPIDTLQFRTDVLTITGEDATDAPESGAYITGLYLEGARWSREDQVLDEMKPGVLFDYMPVIYLLPMRSEELVIDEDKTFACSFFKTAARAGTLSTTGHSTNFVTTIMLPTEKPPDHWIRRGVALLSQLST